MVVLCIVTPTLSYTATWRVCTSEFVGGMIDELGGSYITEYVSNGPNNYAYRTGDRIHVVKVKGFTLNFVASQQLTVEVMKEMAISKRRQINTLPSSTLYQIIFD